MNAATGVSVRCRYEHHAGSGIHHTRYDGLRSRAPKRSKCAECGGPLDVTPAVWAAVPWRGDGRYERPLITWPTPELAQREADGLNAETVVDGGYVVRSFEPQGESQSV